MGKADFFRIGDWNVICDTCGGKFKASDCERTHDGLFTCRRCWDPKHPQESVKAKVDKQRVPISRPDIENSYYETTVAAAVSKWGTTIQCASVSGAAQYVTVGIEVDVIVQDASGITGDNIVSTTSYLIHWSTIASVSSPNITIEDGLIEPASIGRRVFFMTGPYHLTATQISVTGDFLV